MRLQVSASLIATIAHDLKLWLGKGLSCAVGPGGEAEVELPVGEQIATGIEELSVDLEGIAQVQLIIGIILLAVEVNEVKAVQDRFIIVFNIISVAGGGLLLRNGIQHHPETSLILHLYLHQLVELAVGIVPRKARLARNRLLGELGGPVLRWRGGHKIVLAVIAQAGVDAGVILASLGQGTVLVKFGGVALFVPIVIALYAVVVVQHGADTLQRLSILSLRNAAGKGAVLVPRSAPDPLGYPDGTPRSSGPVLNGAKVALGPVAVQVYDIATPSAGVDAVDEPLDIACAVGVVASVPRRR